MHCQRCIKAIKKAIKTTDGEHSVNLVLCPVQYESFVFSTCTVKHASSCADMESYQLDTETNKVTVTGNGTHEEVVKALQKIGKTATSWGELMILDDSVPSPR
jgi:copper chaperone